jgi:hypothetical protein
MKISFAIQLFCSAVIGFFANIIYTSILNGSIGSIGLSVILILTFLVGKFLGDFSNRIDDVSDSDNIKDLKK